MKHPFQTGDSIALSVDRHSHLATGINAAVLMVSLCAGKTAEQVAAEIATRTLAALRAKCQPEAARREVER
jgi:hypothetical protein